MGEEKVSWWRSRWGLVLLGIAGAVAPQLCALIPNAAGSAICATVVRVAVMGVTGAPVAPTDSTAHTLPVTECPPERRLSTGQCLPPLSNPDAN